VFVSDESFQPSLKFADEVRMEQLLFSTFKGNVTALFANIRLGWLYIYKHSSLLELFLITTVKSFITLTPGIVTSTTTGMSLPSSALAVLKLALTLLVQELILAVLAGLLTMLA
jgi:hypothetical protein